MPFRAKTLIVPLRAVLPSTPRKEKNDIRFVWYMIDILKQFKGVVDIPTEKGKLDSLYEQFRLMSKELLYGGYFLIEGKTRICLDDIEFYYHEEGDGGLKDPIMYHTNDHEGKEIPYFEIGRLTLHIYGVGVTL